MISVNLNQNLHINSSIRAQKSIINLGKESDSVTFNGNNYSSSFFVTSFKKLNISEEKFVKKCQKATKIGSGTEGIIFEIPIKGLENFVVKIDKEYTKSDIAPVSKIINHIPRYNFGQPVAKMGQFVTILRRLPAGNSLDKSYSYSQYYEKLSQLPQKKFDNYFK